MLDWRVMVFIGAVLGAVEFTALMLAPREARKAVSFLVLTGFVTALAKIWLFQQAPQWQDIAPDSHTYHLNAQAFARHWDGLSSPTAEYMLRGLKNWQRAAWTPDERLAYTSVYGASDWLYVAYVGLLYWLDGPSQQSVILSHAALAAFLPAAAFGLALALSGSRRVAWAAGVLALLDPSAGVNASWLLKDMLVSFFAMAALWGAVAYLRHPRMLALAVLAVALGCLGASRFIAFLVLLAGLAGAALWLAFRREPKRMLGLGAAALVAWMLFGWLYYLPESGKSVYSPVVLDVQGGLRTLTQAKPGEAESDDAVLRWKAQFTANPMLAIVKSIAHTLFAPYPWVAIRDGLSWQSGNELYYPGVLLWMCCLPGIFVAVVQAMRRAESPSWLVLGFLGCLMAAYTVFQGEWSTRQRVFALPALFALAAMGWVTLLQWWHSPPVGLRSQPMQVFAANVDSCAAADTKVKPHAKSRP